MLAAIVLATWITLRLYLGFPFILDRNMGVFEALSNSDTYMSGNKLVMFAVLLIVGLASGLFACVTCYVGIILVYPFGGILTAVAYLMATGQLPHAGERNLRCRASRASGTSCRNDEIPNDERNPNDE